mgnify:CR=1 FL=1
MKASLLFGEVFFVGGAPMALVLNYYPFTPDDWDDVQSFDCGDREHEKEVSDWLKGPAEPRPSDGSALAEIADNPPARVWLYRLEDEESEQDGDDPIVGFGALGASEWRWTTKKSPYLPITALLWFAVQKHFKRQPLGDEEGFYSSQIMDHLIEESLKNKHERPVLGLCVRPTNTRAIDLYRRKHFTADLDPFTDKKTGITYARMARILDPVRLQELREELQKKK